MKRIICAIALALSLSSTSFALTIPYEHISGQKPTVGNFWGPYSFDIGFFDNALRIDVDVALFGEWTNVLASRWERGIETIWSTNRFDIPILFNVDWVTDGSGGYDFGVNVSSGVRRWNVFNWSEDRYADDHERAAAHEFGHMIGTYDEYVGGSVDPATMLINTGGLMADLAGPTLSYYYDDFLEWYEVRRAEYGGDDPAPVPEPSTFLLWAVGLAGVGWMKRRQVV